MSTDIRRGHTSASNAQADLLCPGRHLAQSGLPDTRGEDADSGQRIHAALAGVDAALHSLSLEERDTFDRCREIEKKLVVQFFGASTEPMRVFREERYWSRFNWNAKEYEHSGMPDAVFRSGTKALVIDYKTLAGEIAESPRNMQLRDLACLVRGHFVVIDQVGTAIIQPMVTHSPELCLYDKADLERATTEMFDRVVRSNDPTSPRVPGETQCKFCKAKLKCAEYQKFAGQMVPGMLSILDVPVTAWTPEQRAVFLNNRGVAKKWIEQCEDAMRAGIEADPSFAIGWGLSPGKNREVITDPQECCNRFVAIGGTVEQFLKFVSVGKTKLREGVNAVTDAKGKALDAAIKTLTEGIVEVTQDRPSLKKMEDEQ